MGPQRRAQLPNEAPQEPAGPEAGRRRAGAQHGGHRILVGLGVERHRGHRRQIAPRVVVAVEEGELLLPVGGIVGGIEVDRDAAGPALEAPPMVRDDRVGQDVPHREQLPPPHGVLEPRQRGLRGQGRSRDRIAVDQQFVDRVVGQPSGVVAVGVAAGDPKDALPEQLERLMLDLARLPLVLETRGQPLVSPSGYDPLSRCAAVELACSASKSATPASFPTRVERACAIQSVAIEPPRRGVRSVLSPLLSHTEGLGGSSLSRS